MPHMRKFTDLVATVLGATLLALLLAVAPPARAGGAKPKPLDPKAGAKSEIFEWTSAGGVVCSWRAPAKYDEAKGANLTVILHGSNLSHLWGFANHDPKSFRPDDFVLVPDGTTPNGSGGFNFMEGDTRKVHDLLAEARKAVKVRQVFLYGHSQGSFFSLAYAGDYPDEVDGLVAHASGMWASSQRGPKGFRQAIVFMHGTQDPVVPYVQSAGSFDQLRKAGYPMVRLRSLEGWNHWPAELNGPVPHTSQQIAWCEGMTTTDPERLRVAFETIAAVSKESPGENDFAGMWSLAGRIATCDFAPADLKERAAKVRKAVEDLAAAQVAALAVPEKPVVEKKPWVGALPVFLRQFLDVPAREELAKKLEPVLEDHQKDGISHLRKYYGALKQGKTADAFEAGVAAVQAGFLWCECQDAQFRKNLKDWAGDAKKLKLPKAAMKTYDAVLPAFEADLTDGWKAYEKTCRTFDG